VFPDEAHLSAEAEDLIHKLVTDSSKRLTFDEMKKHPFFRGVDWESQRRSRPAIVPNVTSEIDVQNFDKFEAQHDAEEEATASNIKHIAEANASFIGYTFKRVENPKPLGADFFTAPK